MHLSRSPACCLLAAGLAVHHNLICSPLSFDASSAALIRTLGAHVLTPSLSFLFGTLLTQAAGNLEWWAGPHRKNETVKQLHRIVLPVMMAAMCRVNASGSCMPSALDSDAGTVQNSKTPPKVAITVKNAALQTRVT